MYLIKIITLLMPMVECLISARHYPHLLGPGISLSPNMFKKTKETKEDMENYLHDNAPFRKNNRVGFEKPKKTRDDLQQYLYEKYNDGFRKSYNPTKQVTEELKYLYEKAPYRKSLQQFRSLPIVVIKLKNSGARSNSNTSISVKDEQSQKNKVKPPEHENVGHSDFELLSIKYKRSPKKKVEHENVGRSYFELSDDDNKPINLKIGTYLKHVEDANKKVLRLGAEGKLQCVAIKTRKRHYDSTSTSWSKEFHSGEKRQFKLWRQHYMCGDSVMPKHVPEPDEQALHPTNYNSTNRLLNEFIQEKIWRPGSPVKKKQPPPPRPKRLRLPLRRKTDGDKYLMPPRTEFEFSELLI